MQARVEGYAAEKRRGYSVYYPDLNIAEVRREHPSRHLIRFAAATTNYTCHRPIHGRARALTHAATARHA